LGPDSESEWRNSSSKEMILASSKERSMLISVWFLKREKLEGRLGILRKNSRKLREGLGTE